MEQTYLYIKQHQNTGLKYFGKTTKDPIKYNGSGKYWKRHLASHGDNVQTIWYKEFNDVEKLKRFAVLFSKLNQIVESKDWANLAIENGTDGGARVFTDEYREKIRQTRLGKSSWNKGLPNPQSKINARAGAAKLSAKVKGRRKVIREGKSTWAYPGDKDYPKRKGD